MAQQNEEKTQALLEVIDGADGSVKNKETEQYIKVLRGKKGKFGPEIFICVEAFEELKATKHYRWVNKVTGHTWIPVQLKCWKNEKKEEAKKETADDLNDELPPF